MEKEAFLPIFRHDLELYSGPEEPDGSPSYNLYDPLNGKYYKISWVQSLIIKNLRKGMTADQLIERINKKTTCVVTKEQLRYFFKHAASLGILAVPKSASQVEVEANRLRVNPFRWLLFHYLYFRVPLFDPDRFLSATLHYVKLLVSKPMLLFYAFVIVAGLAQLTLRFDEFIHTFEYFFTVKGIATFALAMSLIKVLHELGHAYTAKNYGVRVSKMGVAFLVLWPVLYTDVTDSWRLSKRSRRFAISIAGVAVELVISGLCTFLWALSEPGPIQSVLFVVTSATWISTLIVNLNPAMRFDGYYILSDLWGIDNLQARAFAVTRWLFHKRLLGIDEPPPETGLSRGRMVGMAIYSLYTWAYRLLLYTAIALFVYHYFTRTVGLFLFVMEIGIFIVWPLVSELQILYGKRKKFRPGAGLAALFCLFALFLVWFTLPIGFSETFSALVVPVSQQVIYVPRDGLVEQVHVERGDRVRIKEPLVSLSSPDLFYEIRSLVMEKELLEQEMRVLAFSEREERLQESLPEKEGELDKAKEQLEALVALNDKLTLRAEIPGVVYDWDPDLYRGQPVYEKQILGKIADPERKQLEAFIPEDSVGYVQEGETVRFYLQGVAQPLTGRVLQITPARSHLLAYPQLASIHGGELATIENKEGELVLVDSYYVAKIEIEKSPLRYGRVGYIEVEGPKRSRLSGFVDKLQRLFWRESGF